MNTEMLYEPRTITMEEISTWTASPEVKRLQMSNTSDHTEGWMSTVI